MLRKSLIALVVGLLAIPVVAQAGAQFKKPYYMAQEPTITGTVESVTEHSFTVMTEGGEHMTFRVDSRTLMPPMLTPETRVWLEYALMENGDHRAVRVSPIGAGELAEQYQGERPRADDGSNDGAEPVAGWVDAEPAATYSSSGTNGNAIGDDDASGQMAANVDPSGEAGTSGTTETDDGNLPSTASPWPLVQAVGALAVLSGTGMLIVRRRRAS